MELNRNHPVTRSVSDQWYKLCAMLMYKFNVRDVDISVDDLQAFAQSGYCNITVQPEEDTMHLRLVSDAEAIRLAKEAGGGPVK